MLVVAARRPFLAGLMSAFAGGGFSWRGVGIVGMGFALGAAGFVFVLADGRLEGGDFGLQFGDVCRRLGAGVAKQALIVGGLPFPVGCLRTCLGEFGTQTVHVVWHVVLHRGLAVGRGTAERVCSGSGGAQRINGNVASATSGSCTTRTALRTS